MALSGTAFPPPASSRVGLATAASGDGLGSGIPKEVNVFNDSAVQRASRVAAEPGIEPGLRDPNSPVLPLHHSATRVLGLYLETQGETTTGLANLLVNSSSFRAIRLPGFFFLPFRTIDA